MPVIYHLDYWNGFEKILNEIDDLCLKIVEDYKKQRFAIIKLALSSLEQNYILWKENIDKELEEF